jgi:long-chain acyl-CoA synthetase
VFARQQAMDHPDKPAIIMASTGETVTFGEFEGRSNRVAHLLRETGLRRGDHIAILIENSARLLEIEGGAERTGLYYSVINTYLGADEVAYVVANSQAKVLFSSTGKREVAEAADLDRWRTGA